MTVKLPKRKQDIFLNACTLMLKKYKCSIRELSEPLGIIIATFPPAQYGYLHYRVIEGETFLALKANNNDFDATMLLSENCKYSGGKIT